MAKAKPITFRDLSARAYELGEAHGEAAGTWWYADNSGISNATIADLFKIWEGIEDGDPEVMDRLPHADLSGEMADSMTPQKLHEQIEVPQWMYDVPESGILDDLCDSYETAYNMAAENAIRTATEAFLKREIMVKIECSMSVFPNDLRLLMKDLEEVIGKHNADFSDMTIMDMETDDDITPTD